MSKKPGLTVDQHEKLGLELQTMRDRLVSISVELGKAYPRTISIFAAKAGENIDSLRNVLDDKVCQENPNLKNATKIYYRSNRDDYKHSR